MSSTLDRQHRALSKPIRGISTRLYSNTSPNLIESSSGAKGSVDPYTGTYYNNSYCTSCRRTKSHSSTCKNSLSSREKDEISRSIEEYVTNGTTVSPTIACTSTSFPSQATPEITEDGELTPSPPESPSVYDVSLRSLPSLHARTHTPRTPHRAARPVAQPMASPIPASTRTTVFDAPSARIYTSRARPHRRGSGGPAPPPVVPSLSRPAPSDPALRQSWARLHRVLAETAPPAKSVSTTEAAAAAADATVVKLRPVRVSTAASVPALLQQALAHRAAAQECFERVVSPSSSYNRIRLSGARMLSHAAPIEAIAYVDPPAPDLSIHLPSDDQHAAGKTQPKSAPARRAGQLPARIEELARVSPSLALIRQVGHDIALPYRLLRQPAPGQPPPTTMHRTGGGGLYGSAQVSARTVRQYGAHGRPEDVLAHTGIDEDLNIRSDPNLRLNHMQCARSRSDAVLNENLLSARMAALPCDMDLEIHDTGTGI